MSYFFAQKGVHANLFLIALDTNIQKKLASNFTAEMLKDAQNFQLQTSQLFYEFFPLFEMTLIKFLIAVSNP